MNIKATMMTVGLAMCFIGGAIIGWELGDLIWKDT